MDTPNTSRLEDFHVQIHDRMSLHLHCYVCAFIVGSLADSATFSCCSCCSSPMFVCPVSQNAANLGRILAELFSSA